MEKLDYIKYWDIRPWSLVENLHGQYEKVPLIKLPQVKIDFDQYVSFTKDYFDDVEQDYERDRFYNEKNSLFYRANIMLGYNKENTFVLNYGKKGKTNEVLKTIFGDSNLETLSLIKDTVLMRLIVKFPGHGFCWHIDEGNSYQQLFPQYKDKAVRLWMPLSDWDNGHYFQISDTVIHHWEPGQTYQIPWGVPHLGVNFGFRPQFTLNITAIRDV